MTEPPATPVSQTKLRSNSWGTSLVASDPRKQISEYFRPGNTTHDTSQSEQVSKSLRVPLPWPFDLPAPSCSHRPHSFLGTGDKRGPRGFLEENNMKLSVSLEPSKFFSVWRPTSMTVSRCKRASECLNASECPPSTQRPIASSPDPPGDSHDARGASNRERAQHKG